MFVLLVLVALFVSYGVVEYWLHRRNLRQIPIRVQVNGTRGKSSVTRLIAAGLRAGGLRVIAKTTGTTPRFILSDTEEEPIKRLGRANIIENVKIIRRAVRYRPQAIVLECMALVPQYQWTDAHRLIRPTHGVITNARADHLDVMGPTVKDVARALANTIPRHGQFFTAEQEHFPIFAQRAARLRATTVQTQAASVSDEEMKGFKYIEHKENVALALAVCEALHVNRDRALAGMQRARPDPGAMRIFVIEDQGRHVELVNTLAANDPDSIHRLWSMVAGRCPERIVLVNCRADRTDRSRQLAQLCAEHIPAEAYVASGGLTSVFLHEAARCGIPQARLVNAGDRPVSSVYQLVIDRVQRQALVFATGNIVGYGEELIQYFAGKGAELAY